MSSSTSAKINNNNCTVNINLRKSLKNGGKFCRACGIFKVLSQCHKRGAAKEGYRYICKQCKQFETQEYYPNNKEKIKALRKSYKIRQNKLARERWRLDAKYKNTLNIRNRIRLAIKS